MRHKKYFMILILIVPLISGCGLLPLNDTETKKKEVEQYNKMVEETLNSYVDMQIVAEKEKESMLKFVTKDSEWSWSDSYKVKALTPEELDAFQIYSIVYDEYFTSLGASAVREVIIISGYKHRMYVTIIWGQDGILSIDREVKKDEK